MSSAPGDTPNPTPHTTPTKNSTTTSPTTTPIMTLNSRTPPPSPDASSNLYPELSLSARSFSTDSTSSGCSTSSRPASMVRSEHTTRRRGYMRPQGTEFSTSARSRDSVMALGSIAHLQYFFAKTGLLDGKGGGLQVRKKTNPVNLSADTTAASHQRDSTYSSLRSSPELMLVEDHEYYMESPGVIEDYDFDDSGMLPPTTSTYNPRTKPLPPAPDPDVLRNRLRESLAITKRAWERAGEGPKDDTLQFKGFQEYQGTELCELGTAAIRAAKTYYYTTDISLLASKDDRTLREEFLAILDVLKRMAQRKFEGGVLLEERDALVGWVTSVEEALYEEEKAIIDLRRKGRDWLEGSWDGREYDRYHLFLTYFDSSSEPLPPHTPIEDTTVLPTPFLAALQSGLRLILVHNAVVRRSKRPFGRIATYHTEFSKPYRLAENLRYWKKAAEIRFELRLKFDAMDVVIGTSPDAWRDFERDVGVWCRRVLEEVRKDWEMGEGAAAVGQVRAARSATMASLKVEVGDQSSIEDGSTTC